MHRNFVANGGGTELASFHLCVDSNRVVLIVDLTKATYHAGTPRGNYTSGSVETCVNSDGNWNKTKDNLAKLIAAYLNVWGLPISAVVQHNVWYGKDCPHTIRKEGSWKSILEKAGGYLTTLKGTPQPEPPPANQTAIQQYASTHAYVGLPLWGAERAMILEDGREYQCLLYERALLHWRSGEGVGEARIGFMWGECSNNL
jgi:N-acetylmuramoyl-L-alanine amidase CwlA